MSVRMMDSIGIGLLFEVTWLLHIIYAAMTK